MGDESLAINYLRFWYDASNVSKFPSARYISFPDYVESLKKSNPGFLAQLGSDLKKIRMDKVKSAFEALAASDPNSIPKANEFYGAIAAEIQNTAFSDAVVQGLEDTGEQVATVAAFGLGTYALILVGASLIFLLPALEGKVHAFRGKVKALL